MTRNMGRSDRLLRALLVGPLLLAGALAVGTTSVTGVALLVGATIMVATAAMGFCPLYRLFGTTTYRRRAGAQ